MQIETLLHYITFIAHFLSAFLWKLPDIVAVVPRSLEAAGRQEDE